MHSEGFLFYCGGLGWRRVRNRPQPSASVRMFAVEALYGLWPLLQNVLPLKGFTGGDNVVLRGRRGTS